VAEGPYENIRLRRSLAAYPESSDPEFLEAVQKGRVFVLWEIPPDNAQQHIWMVADREGQRSTTIFTSLDRLVRFHDRLAEPLKTSTYAMVAGPSMFVLMEQAGVDFVRTDPSFAEEAHISKEEIADVRARLGDVPKLQMRVLPMPEPQSAQSPAQAAPAREPQPRETAPVEQQSQTADSRPPGSRVDTLSSIPLATAVMIPLLERRVDDAWEAVERLVANGQSDEALRAVSLLLWALLDNGARAAGDDPVALLQEGAEAWLQYAELGNGGDVVGIPEIRRLINEPCGLCAHTAVEHDAAWTLWEYGRQTDGACLVETCACDGFESKVSAL
jgi:hypothetical protein